MPSYKTSYNGFACEFSPFDEERLAVATASKFGIFGPGRQYVLEVDVEQDTIEKVVSFDTPDGLYDCAWSEENENHLVAVSGDGSVYIYDTSSTNNPIQAFKEHGKEVASVHWNLVNKDTFVTGSWDQSIKLWSVDDDSSLETYDEHNYCVYSTQWSPTKGNIFASTSGDLHVKIWDIQDVSSIQSFRAHDHEVLTCDWNKYDENILVTGACDNSIRVWDIRNTEQPVTTLKGHNYAVRRVKCSPHDETIIGSCSYDMTLVIWDTDKDDPLLERYEQHTEFVIGFDFNLENEDQIASTSWDETVYVWNRGEEPIATHDEDMDEDDDGQHGKKFQSMFGDQLQGGGQLY